MNGIRSDNKLYYIPQDGDTIENTVLNVGVTQQLIIVEGCSNLTFRGIDFNDTAWSIVSGEHWINWSENKNHPLMKNIKYSPNYPQAAYDIPAAVSVSGSNGIDFVDCKFSNIGSSALMFGLGSGDCKAQSCLFENIGANAVYIKGVNDVNNESVQTHDITVTDCHIRNYGKIYNNAIGILLVHARDCELSYNEIHDGYYTGISVGWVWGYSDNVTNNIQIKNNLIYNIGQGWLSDMGGIYTLGIQHDTVISGNVIHDVGCYSGDGGYGGWGIYLDEGSSYITVEKNLAYNCSSQGFHQHYGQDNMIRNNIFAFNGEGQMRISRLEDHNSLFFYNNILVGDDQLMYFDPQEGQFKDEGNIYWDLSRKEIVLSDTSTSIKKRKYRVDMKQMGYYNNATFADPMFKDAKNYNFTLAENSPAIKAGFEKWNYDAGTLTSFS